MKTSYIEFLTTLLLCTLLCTSSFADDAQDRAKLEKVKKAIAELKAELEATKGSRDKLLKSLEDSEKSIGELNRKAEQLKKELNQRHDKLTDLREERGQLHSKKREQQKQVGQHINSAYRLGQQSSMRLILNQQDPTSVTRNIKYYNYIIQARAEKIDDFASTIARINSIEPEIAYQTQKLESNHRDLNQQKELLVSAQQNRKNTLGKLNQSISSSGQALKAMNRDRSRLEQLLNEVAEWLNEIEIPSASSDSFASAKGQLPWPANGKVVKHFGTSRVTNKMRWQGMLIRSSSGSPVSAVHHGRIVFSDYLRGHGLLIIVDHGDGYMSLYAHNQALYKELGEWVDRGEVIASVGNTGGLQNSALYFELRFQGQPTNPRKWFRPA